MPDETVRERIPVPVRVRQAERQEEHTQDVRDLPPDWRPEAIPNRWIVRR